MEMLEKKVITIPVIHNQYPLKDYFKDTYETRVISGSYLLDSMGPKETAKIMDTILDCLPPEVKELVHHNYGADYYGYDLVTFRGTIADFHKEARDYLDYFKPLVFDGGSQEDYFDTIPSAVEEFIYMCQAIDRIDLLQELYDSIWQEYHAYCPYTMEYDDPQLYRYFDEVNGIVLHKDH